MLMTLVVVAGTYKLDIAAQTEAVIRNIESILNTAGHSLLSLAHSLALLLSLALLSRAR